MATDVNNYAISPEACNEYASAPPNPLVRRDFNEQHGHGISRPFNPLARFRFRLRRASAIRIHTVIQCAFDRPLSALFAGPSGRCNGERFSSVKRFHSAYLREAGPGR